MKRKFYRQETIVGILFFAPCAYLIFDIVRSVPQKWPALWPIIPMFIAVFWYIVIEYRRAADDD